MDDLEEETDSTQDEARAKVKAMQDTFPQDLRLRAQEKVRRLHRQDEQFGFHFQALDA